MLRLITSRLGIAVVVAALLAAAALAWWPHHDTYVVSADFADTTGVYVGNEVQYLGVPVGEITAIDRNGPVMTVRMRVDEDTKVPREAVAEILQSSLLTDRYVELGPVYRGGPALADGAHISSRRTRSPISFDDLGASIDQLVVALDRQGPDGRDIGDLLAVTARNVKGNGGRIRELLATSRDALATVNAKEPDVRAIARNLDVIVRLLERRDASVRSLTTNLSTASEVVAGQTTSLDRTLRSLSALSTQVADFIEHNRKQLRANLGDVSKVAHTIRQQQDHLSRIFDYMPTGAENISRAYDPVSRNLRVQLAARDMGPFNQLFLQEFCQAFGGGDFCATLTNSQGTGLLDQLFNALEGTFPEGF